MLLRRLSATNLSRGYSLNGRVEEQLSDHAATSRAHRSVYSRRMAEAIEQQRLRGVLRGPECAFAIPRGDLDALDEVAALCCDIWNGAGSLILPISPQGRVRGGYEQYLQIRGVDECFLHARVPPETDATVRALGLTVVRFDPEHIREGSLHPLNLQPGYRDPARKTGLLVPNLDDPRLERLLRMVWGRIDDEDQPEYEKAFELYAREAASAWVALLESQIELTSVLGQSSYLMRPYQGTFRWESRVVFVFDRATFNEVVRFWNMRSRLVSFSGRGRIVGLPRQALRVPEVLGELRRWASEESFEVMKPDLEVAAWGKRGVAALAALEDAGFREVAQDQKYTSTPPESVPAERQPLEYGGFSGFFGDFHRGVLFDTVVALGEGENLIRFTPPTEFRSRAPQIVNFDLLNLPLAFPLNDAAARRSHPQARVGVDGWTLRIWNRGQPFDLPIRLPSPAEALEDYLSPRQLRGALSQAGRYAQALLRRLGGLDRLEALASDAAIAIVDALTPQSAKKLAQHIRREVLAREGGGASLTDEALEEILDRQELFLELPAKTLNELSSSASMPKRDLAPALAKLVSAGLVIRGASLRCPHCNYPDFFPLRELDEELTCRGCRLVFGLPVVDRGERSEQPLHYRLDGLMAQAMDQDLSPSLLLVRRLAAGNPRALYWPGLDLFRGGARDSEAELDLLLANGGQVLVGECKRRAEALTTEEVGRRAALSDELGARPVFAALDGGFAPEVRQAVADAAGYLLDRQRLFGFDNTLVP
jgi:hypothetical protein